jgi:hypothetical protein
MSYSINIDTNTHINTHLYKYTYTHFISMSIFKTLDRLDFEIYKIRQKASYY